MFCSMVLFYDATLLTIHLPLIWPPLWLRIVGKCVQNNVTNDFVESFAQFSCLSQVSSRLHSHSKRRHSKVHTFFTSPRNSVVQGTSKPFAAPARVVRRMGTVDRHQPEQTFKETFNRIMWNMSAKCKELVTGTVHVEQDSVWNEKTFVEYSSASNETTC